jgi:hypothetical protein
MRRTATVTAAGLSAVALTTSLLVQGPTAAPAAAASDPPVAKLVRIQLPSTADIQRLEAAGYDVGHDVSSGPDGTIEATVVLEGDADTSALAARGAKVLSTLDGPTRSQVAAQRKGVAARLSAAEKAALAPKSAKASKSSSKPGGSRPPVVSPRGTLTVLRSDTWTTEGSRFVSLEIRSKVGPTDTVTATTDTGQTLQLSAFVDRGVYLYHRFTEPQLVDGTATKVTVKSGDGTSVTAPLKAWTSGGTTAYPAGFQWGFTDDGYVDATQTDAVIEQLAADRPDLAEVVDLPNPTLGYPEGSQYKAPASYPRGPLTVKAIRIGKHRDGSKTGVLMYAQEHAREWVTSLVAIETAQRLIRNADTDALTGSLLENLDIFIIPQVNPDGSAYSLYDDPIQRNNLNVSGCERPDGNLTNRGVNINRNFSVGSLFDGYVGATATCGSNFAGKAELSEPESRNETYLTKTHPNIKFAMNTHSYGGYFMWSPASYRPDRTTLPRPSLGTENYFFAASEKILSEVREYRDTVVWPGQTGTVVDVLYSAAGNSGDETYYGGVNEPTSGKPEVYAWDFEVGLPRWDKATNSWQDTGAFWPEFRDEGFSQAMEFANGWYGIFEVAQAYELDSTAPKSTPNVDGKGSYSGPVDVLWQTSEPATIYYTTDGSRPTLSSPTVQQDGVRGGALPVTLTAKRTVLQWFSVDEKGNIEGGYDPNGKSSKGLNREVIKIR